jgi:hypothetical protein
MPAGTTALDFIPGGEGVVIEEAELAAKTALPWLMRFFRSIFGRGATRALRAADFGAAATVKVIRGTIGVENEVATVAIEYVEGNLGNPITALNALKETARRAGAKSLRIEATIANERLEPVLRRILGPPTPGVAGGAQDIWTLAL